VIAVDFQTHTLTLDRSLSWTAGQGVAYAFAGDSPDPGLFETGAGNSDCPSQLEETLADASVIPAPAGSQPAVAVPFVIDQTGVRVTRITDGADSGGFSSGYTNGYSRWSPLNISAEYLTAFASNGGAAIYRLSDRSVVRTLNIGESNELHWDSSAAPGAETRLYYRTGAQLRSLDILSGQDGLVHDFAQEYPQANYALNGVEGAPSFDMRYWAFQVCTGMTGGGQCTGILDVIVYDLQQDLIVGRLSDQYASFPVPNFVEMSPSGQRVVVGTCAGDPVPFNGPYAWDRDFTNPVRLSTGCTHSGWAWAADGTELYVNFDPCGASNDEITFSCDYLMAIAIADPQGWENRMAIMYQGDLGWGASNHMGRIYDANVRGWFFMSTYGGGEPWSADQLLMIELKAEADGPRLLRISHTLNTYEDYWSEAFASLDFSGTRIFWGANWIGQAELQIYMAELCPGWWNR
jgi:hypothetical protein